MISIQEFINRCNNPSGCLNTIDCEECPFSDNKIETPNECSLTAKRINSTSAIVVSKAIARKYLRDNLNLI